MGAADDIGTQIPGHIVHKLQHVGAGAGGNRKAFVMALSMNPLQIQRGDIIARSSDKPKRSKQKEEAEIAFVEDERIYIEPVSKSVLNDITI